MCGIAGALVRGPVDGAQLRAMARALAHRGPDGEGIVAEAPFPAAGDVWQLGLVHRRLAVFGPGEAGAQPFASRSGRSLLVYNGELYDHTELRRRLPGFPWRTGTDTEVLVELLEAFGTSVLDRVRGMFAFAWWDRRGRVLRLGRDAVGVKPLYWRAERGALSFASELAALLEGPAFPRRLDPDALSMYLDLGFVPGPRSILEGVGKLPPGTLLEWRDGAARVVRWWRPPHAAETPEPGWREALAVGLRDAVRLQLRGDVPVGTFLSGGLDSTLVTALAARLRPGLPSFSVRLPECRALDESPYARAAAAALGTRHTEVEVRGADVASDAPHALAGLDEPLADSSLLVVRPLARRAREEVTVALSGDGADELFAGYRRYAAPLWLARWERIPAPLRRRVLEPALRRLGEERGTRAGELGRRARKVLDQRGLDEDARILAAARIFDEAQKARLVPLARRGRPGATAERLRELRARHGGRDALDRWLRLDLACVLPDDMLTKVDRASMAFGLEVRVPFLDARVLEAALRLPSSAKRRGGRGKGPLRDVFAPLLPAAVRRRRKAGFDAPLGSWLRGPLRPLVRDVLDPLRLEGDGWIDGKAAQELALAHERREADHSWRLWSLVVLCDWMRRHRVG